MWLSLSGWICVMPLRRESWVLVPPQKTLSPSYESLVSPRDLSPTRKIIYSPADETISPSDEAFVLFGRDFHWAIRKDLWSSLSICVVPLRCDSWVLVPHVEILSPFGHEPCNLFVFSYRTARIFTIKSSARNIASMGGNDLHHEVQRKKCFPKV